VSEAGTPVLDVVVDPSIVFQTMNGFGAADVFAPGGALTTANAQLFFDPVNGIGLSILRIGIDVDGTPLGGASVYSDVQAAASYGAIVWAAPWSPPAAFKDNNNVNGGGHLLSTDYDAWASVLAGFAATLKQNTGVDLYGVSAQNEPDFSAPYSSCLYSSQEMVDFVKVLGPKLAALTPPVRLLAAEPSNWMDLWGGTDAFGTAILADITASTAVGIIATHDYGFGPVAPPGGVPQPIWETEVSGVMGSPQAGPSSDIANGIVVAQWIASAIVTGGASAWHYWWLISANNDNEGLLLMGGVTTKRLYTLGNFSKFVRPSYQRVGVSGAVPIGVQIVAFNGPTDRKIAIVVINAGTSAVSVSISIGGTASPNQVTPWVTSASDDLVAHSALKLTGARFSTTVEPQSVTTFVGGPSPLPDGATGPDSADGSDDPTGP
jgi:glucuronoarabinoxylan endo-1,4-beta-xylanase